MPCSVLCTFFTERLHGGATVQAHEVSTCCCARAPSVRGMEQTSPKGQRLGLHPCAQTPQREGKTMQNISRHPQAGAFVILAALCFETLLLHPVAICLLTASLGGTYSRCSNGTFRSIPKT